LHVKVDPNPNPSPNLNLNPEDDFRPQLTRSRDVGGGGQIIPEWSCITREYAASIKIFREDPEALNGLLKVLQSSMKSCACVMSVIFDTVYLWLQNGFSVGLHTLHRMLFSVNAYMREAELSAYTDPPSRDSVERLFVLLKLVCEATDTSVMEVFPLD
jgi:hypothetical protein